MFQILMLLRKKIKMIKRDKRIKTMLKSRIKLKKGKIKILIKNKIILIKMHKIMVEDWQKPQQQLNWKAQLMDMML